MDASDSYASLRNLVRGIFSSAISGRGLRPYQSFAYTYDEVEGGFSNGEFARLCLLVALFVCAKEVSLSLDYEDPFTQDVLCELKKAVQEFEARSGDGKPFSDDDLVTDMRSVRDMYLAKFDPL